MSNIGPPNWWLRDKMIELTDKTLDIINKTEEKLNTKINKISETQYITNNTNNTYNTYNNINMTDIIDNGATNSLRANIVSTSSLRAKTERQRINVTTIPGDNDNIYQISVYKNQPTRLIVSFQKDNTGILVNSNTGLNDIFTGTISFANVSNIVNNYSLHIFQTDIIPILPEQNLDNILTIIGDINSSTINSWDNSQEGVYIFTLDNPIVNLSNQYFDDTNNSSTIILNGTLVFTELVGSIPLVIGNTDEKSIEIKSLHTKLEGNLLDIENNFTNISGNTLNISSSNTLNISSSTLNISSDTLNTDEKSIEIKSLHTKLEGNLLDIKNNFTNISGNTLNISSSNTLNISSSTLNISSDTLNTDEKSIEIKSLHTKLEGNLLDIENNFTNISGNTLNISSSNTLNISSSTLNISSDTLNTDEKSIEIKSLHTKLEGNLLDIENNFTNISGNTLNISSSNTLNISSSTLNISSDTLNTDEKSIEIKSLHTKLEGNLLDIENNFTNISGNTLNISSSNTLDIASSNALSINSMNTNIQGQDINIGTKNTTHNLIIGNQNNNTNMYNILSGNLNTNLLRTNDITVRNILIPIDWKNISTSEILQVKIYKNNTLQLIYYNTSNGLVTYEDSSTILCSKLHTFIQENYSYLGSNFINQNLFSLDTNINNLDKFAIKIYDITHSKDYVLTKIISVRNVTNGNSGNMIELELDSNITTDNSNTYSVPFEAELKFIIQDEHNILNINNQLGKINLQATEGAFNFSGNLTINAGNLTINAGNITEVVRQYVDISSNKIILNGGVTGLNLTPDASIEVQHHEGASSYGTITYSASDKEWNINPSIYSTSHITSRTSITVGTDLTVKNSATISNKLYVEQATTMNNTLNVKGDITTQADLHVINDMYIGRSIVYGPSLGLETTFSGAISERAFPFVGICYFKVLETPGKVPSCVSVRIHYAISNDYNDTNPVGTGVAYNLLPINGDGILDNNYVNLIFSDVSGDLSAGSMGGIFFSCQKGSTTDDIIDPSIITVILASGGNGIRFSGKIELLSSWPQLSLISVNNRS